MKLVNKYIISLHLMLTAVASMAAPHVHRIVLYNGPGTVAECCSATEKTIGQVVDPSVPLKLIGTFKGVQAELNAADAAGEKVLVAVPGGDAFVINAHIADEVEGKDLAESVFKYITSHQHNYLGICAGGIMACNNFRGPLLSVEWGQKLLKEELIRGLDAMDNIKLKDGRTLPSFFSMGPTFQCGSDMTVATLESDGRQIIVAQEMGGSQFVITACHLEFSCAESQQFILLKKFSDFQKKAAVDMPGDQFRRESLAKLPAEIQRLEDLNAEFRALPPETVAEMDRLRLDIFRELLVKLGVHCSAAAQ